MLANIISYDRVQKKAYQQKETQLFLLCYGVSADELEYIYKYYS
jgi:hypothetical protein